MKLNIHGKNLTITDAMFDRTTKKLSFLEKYFNIGLISDFMSFTH